jgi:glycosyltransferase involved in cell wall biosynthesis
MYSKDKNINDKPLPEVDIEIVLEGSYPYVTGGVSSWVHRLILGLPEFRFGLIHLAATPKDTEKLKYELPENVIYLHNIFLHDPVFVEQHLQPEKSFKKLFHEIYNLHIFSRKGKINNIKEIILTLCAEDFLPKLRNFFYGSRAFSLLLGLYKTGYSNSSFIDFFWTWRYMHIPLFQIFQAKKSKPRLIHAVSTGYAGFYASVRKLTTNSPVILTEHGIYTRERAIEISRSEHIYTENEQEHRVKFDQGTFKKIWMRFFEVLGKLTYKMSDHIYTLFEGNKKAQISLGAAPEKIEIVPNGISVEKFLGLRNDNLPNPECLQIGFIGRIVSIKDIKTLLRAMKLICLRKPNAILHIIGPLDEEKKYAAAMQNLAKELGISKNVLFHGRQNVMEFYPKLDVCVLTSISEGQPLIILEAMASGVPVVATDVGGCRELIEGSAPEDKALGACGRVTNLSAPAETANAVLEICNNPELFKAMADIGKRRIEKYYRQATLIEKYKSIYQSVLNKEALRGDKK